MVKGSSLIGDRILFLIIEKFSIVSFSDSIEIFQMFQIMNPGGWQRVFQYKGKKKLSLTYIVHTEFAKGKPLNSLTTNNFQLVLGWLWQQYEHITVC